MNHIFKTTTIAALGLVLASCDSFLDEQPSASSDAPIKTVAQLMSIYDYTPHVDENDLSEAYATDDAEIPTAMFDKRPSAFQPAAMCFYTLDGSVMANSSFNYLWGGEYSKIFDANTIIEQASQVSGTEDEKNAVLANAYFMRAWSYFKLATEYCLPYTEANRSKPGLPLRLGTLFTENISRKTLGETFDQILSDLGRAEQLCTRKDLSDGMAWRVSLCAVNGFYARLYLYMNDYEKALAYADKALADAPELTDYNTLKWGKDTPYPATDDMPAQSIKNCETNYWGKTDIYKWKEWIFIRLMYNRAQWFCPSRELTGLYDHDNDMRFVYMFAEHGNRRMNVPYEWYRYNMFNDGSYIISGLTTSELLLDKAECMARTGDWQQALTTLTPLRQARFATGKATALTATTQKEALKLILEERRREFPFAMRLFDMKRLAVNNDPDDDITFTRDFYKVTNAAVETSTPVHISVKGDDPRLALPIPVLDIQNSQGAIEQNPFE